MIFNHYEQKPGMNMENWLVAKEQSWVYAENTVCMKKLANKLRG